LICQNFCVKKEEKHVPNFKGGFMDEKQQYQTAGGIEEADFKELKGDKNQAATQRNIEFLLDIPVEITVQLGATRMPIRELLQLGQGSVVELTKLAGEPMEILANSKIIAKGEVVVVNEKFGVRLTDIISPSERLTQLR